MRKRRKLLGSFLAGRVVPALGTGGGRAAVADLIGSLKVNEPLTALAGCEVEEDVQADVGASLLLLLPLLLLLSRGYRGKVTPALAGLVKTGV